MEKYLSENTPSQGDFVEANEFLKSSVEDVAEYVMHQRHLIHQNNALAESLESERTEKAQLIRRNAELTAKIDSLKAVTKTINETLENTRKQAAKYLNMLQTTNVQELIARVAKLKHAEETGIPVSKINF